ncbi:MAG: bis(5'-nucleosyl)-tetraphosphatase (symmetrical) YqeK [Bacillota bacterium]
MNYKNLNLEKLKNDLKKRLSKKRFVHSLGVLEVATKLAKKNKANVRKAKISALLHDFAKPLSENKLKYYAKKSDFKIDSIELKIPAVLHAPAAAFLVKENYGIIDMEILEAIRFHTIGNPKMKKIALIIFVSDFIEPNRDFPGIDYLRNIAENKCLSDLVVAVCNQSIEYNITRNKIIHPNTLLLRNEYLGG